jgi:tryptophan-rich sensory protein
MAMDWLLNTRTGLTCCVAAAVATAAFGNLLVYAAYRFQDAGHLRIPPGWEWVERIVGFVWLGLFACMGAASWLAYNSGGVNAVRDGRLLIGLLLVCLLYPVYTLGMKVIPGLVANVVVLVLAVVVAVLVWPSSAAAAGLVAPVVVWIILATVYMAKLVALNFLSH